MPRIAVVLLGLMFAVAAAPAARAQVTLDVAKITCDQYTRYRAADAGSDIADGPLMGIPQRQGPD
jgi:hypothetical protein